MITGKFFLAVLVITIAVSFVQWLFVGFLFHKYQALTPAVWRRESKSSYAISMVVALFFACIITLIFSFWKSKYGPFSFTDAIGFGVLSWLAFSLTAGIESAVYVNYSRFFVAGKCISSFFEYTVAAGIAYWIIGC